MRLILVCICLLSLAMNLYTTYVNYELAIGLRKTVEDYREAWQSYQSERIRIREAMEQWSKDTIRIREKLKKW